MSVCPGSVVALCVRLDASRWASVSAEGAGPAGPMPDGDERWETIVDGEVVWRFDRGFLSSHWTCIWSEGCQGILDTPTPDLAQGCCSVGARIEDEEEAMLIVANAATLDPDRFEHHEAARLDGVFADATPCATRIVDGACIFLNRPGFAGGEGCALHLAALDQGESPIDWKPSVCWRLPLAMDWSSTSDGRQEATVRRWTREDWGPGGASMAWWCPDEADAHVADTMLVDRMQAEIAAITGTEVAVELRRRLLG